MILFGFQHVGKSFYGAKLAQKLNLPFLDTDLLIEEKIGYSFRTLWQESEEKYREVEKEVIANLPPNHVIATGGGAILDIENRKQLAKLGKLIYLKMKKETLKMRYKDPKKFEELYAFRLPIYEAIPAQTVELDDKSIEEVLWEATH